MHVRQFWRQRQRREVSGREKHRTIVSGLQETKAWRTHRREHLHQKRLQLDSKTRSSKLVYYKFPLILSHIFPTLFSSFMVLITHCWSVYFFGRENLQPKHLKVWFFLKLRRKVETLDLFKEKVIFLAGRSDCKGWRIMYFCLNGCFIRWR